MRLLGLTGNIACGKSTLAGWLRDWGAELLDADQLVHELYSDTEFSARIASLFGKRILNSQGTVDRKELASVVFGDAAAMRLLEKMVHPAVAALRAEKLEMLAAKEESPLIVVLEAVKLLESGQARGCEAVWCVSCSPEVQLKRLKERRGLSEAEALARLSSQPPNDEKKALAREQNVPLTFLANDTSLDELKIRARNLWEELLQKKYF